MNSSFKLIREINKIINLKGRLLLNFCIIVSILTAVIDLLVPFSFYNLFNILQGTETTISPANQLLQNYLPSIFLESLTGSALFVFLIIVFANSFRLFTLFLNTRTSAHITRILFSNLFKKAFSSEYLVINNPEIKTKLSSITSYSPQIMGNTILNYLQIVSYLIIAITIISGIQIFYPEVIIIIASMVFFYFIIFKLSKYKIKQYNKIAAAYTDKMFRYLNLSLDNIAYTKIEFLSGFYTKEFSRIQRVLKRIQSNTYLIGGSPRLFLEVLFVGILLFLITSINNSTATSSPDFVVIIVAFQRLLPSLQGSYSSIISLNSSYYMLNELLNLINTLEKKSSKPKVFLDKFTEKNKNNHSLISLNNISLTASWDNNLSRKILNNISLDINKNKWINIVGISGSGKTSLIEVICGLRFVESGFYKYDNEIIDSQEKAKKYIYPNIGYVSQNCSFIGLNIEDIIFGNCPRNYSKFNQLINLLNLEYLTNGNIIKENINFSGGERQRLVIARALYKDPEVIILDEATSSLDDKTQIKILEYLNSNRKDKTIIFVTHRKESLKYADYTYTLEKGKIIDNRYI